MPAPDPSLNVQVDKSTASRQSRQETLGPGTDLSTVFRVVDNSVAAVRAELMGEVRALTAAMREGEARRSADVDRMTRELAQVPSIDAINKANRKAVIALGGITIALIALLWTVFGVGAAITGGIADRVIDSRESQRRIEQKLDGLVKERVNEQAPRESVQPPPESNGVGNAT